MQHFSQACHAWLLSWQAENMTSLRTAGLFGEDKQKGRKPSAIQSRQNRFKNLARKLQLIASCALLLLRYIIRHSQ